MLTEEGAKLPLRTDLVSDLREWLGVKLEMLREMAIRGGEPIALRLPLAQRVFTIPRDMVRIFDRDLVAAGIPKRDERGRTVDVHALRHTFGTHLSLNGVAPRVAQAAMRHSTIELTMNVYTDPELLDVAGAVAALPDLALSGSRDAKLTSGA